MCLPSNIETKYFSTLFSFYEPVSSQCVRRLHCTPLHPVHNYNSQQFSVDIYLRPPPSSSSSAYCSPLLDVGLPQGTQQDQIFRFSHPITLFKSSVHLTGGRHYVTLRRPPDHLSSQTIPFKCFKLLLDVILIHLSFRQVLRTMYMDQDRVADMVPVDLCVNAILASAWFTAKNYKEK